MSFLKSIAMHIAFYFLLALFATVSSDDVLLFEQTVSDITTTFPDTAMDPSEDISSNLLKEMCHRQAGAEFVNTSVVASANLQSCALQIVLKHPSPSGPVNEGVKTMCDRFAQYKGCVSKYLSDLEICFAENEKWAPPLLQNLTETIIDFMCENQGRNTVQFLEKGPECVRERQEALGTCTKNFFTEIINSLGFGQPGGVNSTSTSSTKAIELKDCKILRKYRKCVMAELVTCTNRIPATIVDKVFHLIERFTSCYKYAPCDIDPECKSQTRWSIFNKSQS